MDYNVPINVPFTFHKQLLLSLTRSNIYFYNFMLIISDASRCEQIHLDLLNLNFWESSVDKCDSAFDSVILYEFSGIYRRN